MAQSTWQFVWSSMVVEGLFPSKETGWILQGRKFVSPGTGWVVAHDVFHHVPGDSGSFADEVATFGAQTLMEPHTAPADLQTSLFSVMALVLENGTRGITGLALPPAPLRKAVDPALEAQWKSCYVSAMAELREAFGEWASAGEWEDLVSVQGRERAVGWMRAGYLAAQKRFPDLDQARCDFAALQKLASEGREGEILRVEFPAGVMQAARFMPDLRQRQRLAASPA